MTAACPGCAAAPYAQSTATADAPSDVVLSVPGLHCAGCIGTVERALSALPGVRSARVNLSLKRVSVATDRAPADLIAHLADVGYEAFPLNRALLDRDADPVGRDLILRLGIAGFAMMNVMLLSVAVWSGATEATRDLFHLISAAISLPAVAFSGQPFFRNALGALRAGRLNMDVPISLAILLAAGMSLFEALHGGAHAYFDAALSLTFFLLIGRTLDHRSRSAARSAAKELSALESFTAIRECGQGTEEVETTALRPGDVVLVPTGVRVPVDGTLQSAQATTDRSFLTGESAAVETPRGAALQAGEVNLGPAIRVTATAVGEDTTLRRMAQLVEQAESVRNRYTALADRAARIYAPAVHLLALGAFLGWWMIGGDLRQALNVAIAVLIITCPCALGLAVPAVSTAAIGRLYGLGFLVKNGTALERLAEVDAVVFDKTGTLTLPTSAAPLAGLDARTAPVALALAQASDHPLSRALVRALDGVEAATVGEIEEVAGHGVQGLWNGQPVRLGRGGWIGAGFDGPGLSIAGDCRPLDLGETLRPGAAEAVAALKQAGPVAMITGDRDGPARLVAKRLGIDEVHAAMSPEGKTACLDAMRAEGRTVAMVGDGLNDTVALVSAHASIAPSSALDAARNAADIVILSDSLAKVPQVLSIARAAVRLSRQNFAIAAAYNAVAIPLALAGLATPLLAALAMSASSLTVLANALRIRWMS